MYEEFRTLLVQAGSDEAVHVVVVTGRGDYFSSGNDLNNFKLISPKSSWEEIKAFSHNQAIFLEKFVDALIEFPKILIAAVNGPSFGIAVTMLGLFDMVYASKSASFETPFSRLGQSPEGCSSYIFPRIMGPNRANEVLYAGRKLSAEDAQKAGLVSEVFGANEELMNRVLNQAKHLSSLPQESLQLSKKLVRSYDKKTLKAVNKAECELLEDRWVSPDCIQAIMKFMARSSNKKSSESKAAGKSNL
eukprot:TRINITY_DN16291_c0_g2_i3.p1 TRINITY_DN16291_c0_g2~~TRINITY_DN16291_c0_g2_i3.p1  ORF type:complete len:288 (-),score=96.78 TRINITY_DN16291_c0_g2_i3:78-818(-)